MFVRSFLEQVAQNRRRLHDLFVMCSVSVVSLQDLGAYGLLGASAFAFESL